MSLADDVKAAEADFAALGRLPGEIQDRVEAGVAKLTAIRDEIDATIKVAIGTASAQLAALKSTALKSTASSVASATAAASQSVASKL